MEAVIDVSVDYHHQLIIIIINHISLTRVARRPVALFSPGSSYVVKWKQNGH